MSCGNLSRRGVVRRFRARKDETIRVHIGAIGIALAAVVAACGPPFPWSGGSGDGALLDGVPGDCELLETRDPELHDQVLAAIDGGVSHGPLVVARVRGAAVVATTTYDRPGVEGRGAAWSVDEDMVVAINDEAARISSFPAQPIDSAGEDALAGAMAEAEDCSFVAADRSAPDPPEPEPEMRPDLMVVEPAIAAPGQQLALRFPEQTARGIAFELHRRTAQGWVATHRMNSDANGAEYAGTAPVGAQGFGSIDVGVGGPGPDHVSLPRDVPPGEYRVCTANAGDEFCSPLTIADG